MKRIREDSVEASPEAFNIMTERICKASGISLLGGLSRIGSTVFDTTTAPTQRTVSEDRAPDYVLLFRTTSKTVSNGETQLEALLRGLNRVGLRVEVRHGGRGTLLLFVRCPDSTLNAVVRKARYVMSPETFLIYL